MKEKGFTYIIIVVFIMIFVTMLFLISKNINYSNKIKHLVSNYKTEINYLSENNLIDVNSLDEFNINFKEFIKSNNYNSKACGIYFDGNKYILSNYLDANYTLIQENQTIEILAESVSEDIIFGNCEMDISLENSLSFYIEIYNDSEKSIYKQ
ncbi:hypothetical protein GW835_00635 [archaeon]|nr:hypothetical protein [archaeon]NCP79062.1 hypothetical protein [archaeon]NCP97555.1 hypothetical protein [archaeon]NCQ06829.1 hypothetical protein [archaeon]NCQ50625.1 hypothetical protein [archaeon]